MADPLAGALRTAGMLVLVALPGATLGGAAVLLPWDRSRWTLAHWGRMAARHGWVVAGLVLMLIPEVIESQIDPAFTALLPAGLQTGPTTFLAHLEGSFHHDLQAAMPWEPLRLLFTAIYVAGYPFIIIACIMLPVWMDRGRVARQGLAAYALSFAVALPFYLFLPVDEVWHHYGDASVHNVINDYQVVRDQLYSFNDLNNCFPSLHTGISVVLAAVVWRSDLPRRFRVTVASLAGAIVFSTLYLGIHWVADVVAGLLLAWGVAWFVGRYVREPRAMGTAEPIRRRPD